MGKLAFISKTDDIDLSVLYRVFAAPSPDNDYSIVLKYYRNESMKEGDYETKYLSYFYSELYLYVRKKNESSFTLYKYDGNVWIHRHIVDKILYDDIMNLDEISTDIQKEWDYLIHFV